MLTLGDGECCVAVESSCPDRQLDGGDERDQAMPYLVAADLPAEAAGRRFRKLVERPGILGLPGAHNGMAALQAKAAGFDALYLSGAAMSASIEPKSPARICAFCEPT